MHALLGSAAVAILLAAPAQSRAPGDIANAVQPPAQVRAKVESYLGSIDTPVTAAQWKALGPDGARVLEQIALDHKKLPTRRARAVSALALVGAAGAPQLMIDLAGRETEKPIVRMSAVRGAGQLLEPGALVTAIQPVLEKAADLHVRATAAEVLTARAPATACPMIRAQTTREKSTARPAFTRALKACDPLPVKP